MYFQFLFLFFLYLSMLFFIFIFKTLIEGKVYVLSYSFMNLDTFLDFNFIFYFDYLSNLFLLVISLISMTTFLYSKSYMNMDKNKNKFLFLTFLFVFSMFVVVLSFNFLSILVGWDCLGVVSYFLVIHYYSDNSDYSGVVTLMTNRLGDVSMIFCLYMGLSVLSMDFYILKMHEDYFGLFIVFICICGFTKSAQFPFSVWLPLAMAAPTPISALVHSSTLVTAGVYIFIRFDFLFKIESVFNSILLILIGLTMLVASFGALSDLDIKKIVAYSTLSQLGLMMMAVVMGNEIFSFFHIITHALFKALLFLCSGIFIHSCFDNQDIRCYNYSLKLDLFIVSVFFICSLSLAGFPFLSGFYSKDLILESVYMANYNLFFIVLLLVNIVITGVYSFRLIYYAMMMSKKNAKLIFVEDWPLINNSVFYLFLGVIFSGSATYWLLMLKFDLFFMSISLKLTNLFLVLFFYLLFYYSYLWLDQVVVTPYMSYFMSMFYLKNYQGFIFNNLYKHSLVFSFNSEFFNEYVLFYSFYEKFASFSSLLKLFKMFMFYFCVLFLFMIYMYIN